MFPNENKTNQIGCLDLMKTKSTINDQLTSGLCLWILKIEKVLLFNKIRNWPFDIGKERRH